MERGGSPPAIADARVRGTLAKMPEAALKVEIAPPAPAGRGGTEPEKPIASVLPSDPPAATPSAAELGAANAPARAQARRTLDERVLFHEELSWKQLDRLPRDRTVFLVTLSPLDQHGPHLPIGVDCFTAQAFAAAAAREICKDRPDWYAVLSPTIPVGSNTCDYLGSVDIRRRAIRDLLFDYGASLAEYEFENILVVNAHSAPGHLMAIDEACAAVSDRFGITMFSPTRRILARLFGNAYRESIRKALPPGATDPDFSTDPHAGQWETSMMLYLRPELVDTAYSRLKPVMVDAATLDETSARTLGDKLGYFGAPAAADRELGKISVALVAREIAELFSAAKKDPNLLAEFRPPVFESRVIQRTDFFAWVLAASALLLAFLLGMLV